MSRARKLLVGVFAMLVAALLVSPSVRAASPDKTTPIVVRVEHGGFRFSDAAIGAAAGAGAALTAVGCVALLRLQHEANRPQRKGEGE
jgi:hypothetical protein